MADIRAQLEAIAAGSAPAARGRAVVNPALVRKHQAEFTAWARFTEPEGEPITAPAELLAPPP